MKTKVLGFFILLFIQYNVFGQAVASSQYATQTGALGGAYSWIDVSGGTQVSFSSADDGLASISWPFNFSFYDNSYTTTSNLSIGTNGFIRLDGDASTSYINASNYNLTSNATNFGQIIALAMYDGNTTEAGSTVKYLVTGTAPNRILTIEYNDLEISWSDNRYASVQVSFYESSDKIVLKLGADNINRDGVDMGLHSGVDSYFHKWQEVRSGTNNTYIEYTRTAPVPGPAASWNYGIQTGNNGTIYSWIDCSVPGSSNVVSGQNTKAEINWPFDFSVYDNNYTTSDNLSVASNGFIRLDGLANTNNGNANNYDLISNATQLGQIIALGVNRGKIGDNGGYVRSLVTGSQPNRVFTIEFSNREIRQNANKFASTQVSFYESSNKIVLKLGADNITQNGADMGIHSGVSTYFDKWQEIRSGTNNTWIEYTPPFIEVAATAGTPVAYYSTLKGAFDKINDGTHRGEIEIKINDDTEETNSAVLNGSGTGSANYTSVHMYPTVTGLSISGNLNAPLIDLSGADNVTIDGRVNGVGTTKDLTIINNSTSNAANTSTIRFINQAENNTLQFCNIKGSETNTASGVLYFSNTNGVGGNSNNTIINNNITTALTNNRPVNAIYSFGTVGRGNLVNTIENNNIYDFFNATIDSNGILLESNTNAWTIDGNSFYETQPFTAAGFPNYNVINVSNNIGENFKILNNYIGGSNEQCTGTAWTKTSATNNTFNAISINVSVSATSSIQNNTIQNFDWNNSSNANWTGIEVLGGNVNIGTITGNTIGSGTVNDLITVTGAVSGLNVYGIKISGNDSVNCINNVIGSITTNNGTTRASNIYGIYKANSLGTTNISDNFIGSTTITDNINASSSSTNNNQVVYGIYNAGIGTITIFNNVISNLTNGTTNTSTGSLGVVHGINSSAGSLSVFDNEIYNLSNSNANNSVDDSASVTGISLTGVASEKTIKGNIIYNLENNFASFSGSVIGLYYNGSLTGSNTISENFIYDLSVNNSSIAASIYGIKIAGGVSTYANNIISIGGNTRSDIFGIYMTSITSNNYTLYYNTIYIEGNVASGTNNSYALFSNAAVNVRDIRNNIFMNARSTTGGSNLHYAAYFNYSTDTNITLDYNDYFVSGTGGVLGYWNSTNQTTLPIITGQDANSLAINPTFTAAGGTNFINYIASSNLPGEVLSVVVDYEGISRGNPPKMGALESSLPFVWVGTTSTDFATASNWQNGAVPLNGADIIFAAFPTNDCHLDQNRTIRRVTNASDKKLVLNGHQLTLTVELVSATVDQIDATAASSMFVFGGSAVQNLTSTKFVSNTLDGLTINNIDGLTQIGDITIENQLTLTNGAYTIGANTLTINGGVTTTSGTLVGGSTSNISIGGSGASTGFPSITANDFELNRANGISLEGNITVGGDLDLTNGSLTLNGNTLTFATNTINKGTGDIVANQISDTVDFQNTTAYTMPLGLFNSSTIENFTISGAGGITINNNLTVNGILNLQNSNPSATKGLLDVTFTDNSIYNELSMGANSTTVGQGDVTGVIGRYAFSEGESYSFGNKNTLTTFNAGAIALPTWLKVRIIIGVTPVWRPGGIQRIYRIIQNGGNNSIATFRASFLDSELNGNVKSELSFWTPTNYQGAPPPVDSGRSNFSLSENWMELSDVNISFFFPSFTIPFEVTLDETGLSFDVWAGTVSTDWNNPLNWASNAVPVLNSIVRIPDASTTNFDPTLPPNATTEIEKIILDFGSILNSGATDNAELTVNDNIGSWSNNGGVFNPGNSTVNFIRRDDSDAIVEGFTTISGTTNFNNIYIGELTTLLMGANSSIQVVGSITINEVGANRGVLNTTSSGNTTVNYNGANQTVVVTDASSNKYSTLILSGTGTKTMPSTALETNSYFVILGSATVTAASSITVGNEFHVAATASFTSGVFNHNMKDNFDIDGVYVASAGSKITFNGSDEQLILGDVSIDFESLEVDNTAGVKLETQIAVNDELILTNGNLNVGATELSINGDVSKTSGFINVNLISSLAFGNSTALTLPSNLFFDTPSFKDLTINSAGGVILGEDITVNGILNMQSNNPTDFIGGLDTGSFILNMGATATTVGDGDVTGKIRRTTILPNIFYSFGHKDTEVYFENIGTLPIEITLKTTLGTAPTWDPTGVKRVMDIASVGAADTKALIRTHYLHSELNGLDENNLNLFSYVLPQAPNGLIERGRTEINTNENWISFSNANFGNLLPVLGVIEHGISVSTTNVLTWDGSESTVWNDVNNWTPQGLPALDQNIIIPDAATTPNDPTFENFADGTETIKTIDIQSGAILNVNGSDQLEIVGSVGAWANNGTFNASTGNVLFNHGVTNEVVTIAGVTNFYDIEVGANTSLEPVAGNILRIENALTSNAMSVVDFSEDDNIVEWNGANQTIIAPLGVGGASGYYNLILSGSGTKTLPNTELFIRGDFSTSGTISTTAQATLNIDGDVTIGAGTTFITDAFEHEVGGNLVNNGTFTATSGGIVKMNGTVTQTIQGSSPISFDSLTIENLLNVSLAENISIVDELLLLSGNLVVADNLLEINGTISNPSGAITVNSTSNLSFGGTSALTLNNNLFSTEPEVNNLTIDRSGGVSLGNQNMTVGGVFDAVDGTLSLLDNTLIFSGNSPIRTTGNIDASNASSEVLFTNTSAITLPDDLFTGDITNLTVNGTGGVISNGDLTVTGILNLESNNPSTTKGSLDMAPSSIIDMGENATTIGLGDVTGIVKREHTFLDGVEYSFGNEFTSFNFLNVPSSTKPTWIQAEIKIGTAPSWRNQAINRTYSFAQSGGTDRMIVKLHYLDNELHGAETDESQLVFWDGYDPDLTAPFVYLSYPRNYNERNTNENWVQFTGPAINYIATSNLLDVKQWSLSYTNITEHTWIGLGSPTYPGDWSLPGHWDGGVPHQNDKAIIPTTLPTGNSGYPDKNLLPIIAPSEVNLLEIEAGATLSATDYDITIHGNVNAWVNNGTFIPGTSAVIFNHPYDDDFVYTSISGTTNFYDLIITEDSYIQPVTNSIIRVENVINVESGGVLDFTTNVNTIEYNGINQGVINPNGGTTGYYNLTLSGSGIKSLPTDVLGIENDFSLMGSTTAITKNDLTVGNDLNLANTSNLTIVETKTLTVDGDITNTVGTNGLVLKSTINGTASLIHDTNNVPATVERYISGAAEDWHFLSSPVSNQIIKPVTPTTPSWVPSGTYGNGAGYDLYIWDEATPCWVYHDGSSTPSWSTVHSQTNFIPGRGYLYSVQAVNPTKEFKGNLNNGTVNYAITANCPCTEAENTDLDGFNLIGNPYPSSIDWTASSGWTRSNLEVSAGGYDMWIWNPAANNYGVFNSNGLTGSGTNDVTEHIAPMQGFFVRAISNANITMTNAIRLHDGASDWMKPSTTKNNIHNLKVQIASDAKLGFDEVIIQFGHSSNSAGAAKLFSTEETAPSAYLTMGKEKLSVKYLTDTINNPFVPLAFKPGAEGNYTLNIKDFDYSKYEYIILEDKKTKTFHDLLSQSNYKFKSSLKDKSDRFVLHFTSKKPNSDKNDLSALIYYNGEAVVVDLTEVLEQTEVIIYDMLGKRILNKTLAGQTVHYLTIQPKNQVYIVVAKSGNESTTKKVVVY